MNTGIQDVHNLCWKLALVLQGMAGESLLGSYEAERLPVGRRNVEQSFQFVLQFQREDFGADLNTLGYTLGTSYESKAVIPDGTEYPAETDPLRDYRPSARPGSRAPHMWLERNGQRLSTLDLFDRDFTLLTGPAGQGWLQAGKLVAEQFRIPLHSYHIGENEEMMRDIHHQWATTYGVTAAGAVLVRPDGHVACGVPSHRHKSRWWSFRERSWRCLDRSSLKGHGPARDPPFLVVRSRSTFRAGGCVSRSEKPILSTH